MRQVENVIQMDVEDNKDRVERKHFDELWTMYQTLEVKHKSLAEQEDTKLAEVYALRKENEELKQQNVDDLHEFQSVVRGLKDQLANLRNMEMYSKESEIQSRNLRCKVAALEEENAELQSMKQLAKLLAKEFVKEDAE